MRASVDRAWRAMLLMLLVLAPQLGATQQAVPGTPPGPAPAPPVTAPPVTAPPVTAPSATPPKIVTPVSRIAAPPSTSWQHAGSDIPADPQWRTGTLANGLRYAVRRNARPTGNVAIRVRLDVGALMEADQEQGWAHFVEHMVFRGTPTLGDGEAVKVWQRMGARFGADTNAFTSRNSTLYQLDLPKSDAASVATATGILADMLANASIDAKLVEIERKVVLAERAARSTPLSEKFKIATNTLFIPGLLSARRDIIGTPETLAAASADRLRAFQRRWYRPERAVVIIVGDTEPSDLITAIETSFGRWQGDGPKPTEPDYGTLASPPTPALSVVDPLAPSAATISWIRPFVYKPDTLKTALPQVMRTIALAILNRRLSTETQATGPINQANASYGSRRHDTEALTIAIMPKPGAFSAALDRTFAIVNGLRDAPPAQAEIDQELANLKLSVDRAIIARPDTSSAGLATLFANDVDRGSVSASPEVVSVIFGKIRPVVTPALIQSTIRDLLAPDPRMLVSAPTAIDGGDATLLAALARARTTAAAQGQTIRAASLDELKAPGPPGTVASTRPVTAIDAERIMFANGVELDIKQTAIEKNAVTVLVQIGHGALNRDADARLLDWSSGALISMGIGPFSADELARVTSGRQIGFNLRMFRGSLDLNTQTNRRDLADSLRLMTALVDHVRYAESSLERFKAGFDSGYATIFSQPGSVLSAYGESYLTNGDKRFAGIPDPKEVRALSNDAFRAYWDARMAEGPIKIVVVGDYDRAALIAAVAASFGALPPRQDVPPTAAQIDVRPSPPTRQPITLYHRGAADQAIFLRNWPTTGLYADIAESRALTIAASILQTQLTENFREQQGGSYAPSVGSNQSDVLPRYGMFRASAQLLAEKIPAFEKALAEAIAALAANGPPADDLERTRSTILSSIAREKTTDNRIWLSVLARDLDDPRVLSSFLSRETGYAAVTAEQVQAVVRKYLKPRGAIDIRVLPEASKPAR
ncbi:MAG: hypothetical protein B7Y43_11455 [Sphingomonas sp. 28-62-20]|uniref:M16 family metallopeptidase n=1 Tax=Sphingomonas sp. 28-62-20 TaxID=1970433 RepID=UPI000BC60BDE|nr:MAG: hypothetical protein B7Y43_11455 [Sphingomonas sp. 28-62-20]